MLIEFSVENFKCFAEKQTLDMRPDPDITSLDENLIRTGLVDEAGEELVLLPSVAIYGANASGKSSLIDAISTRIKYDMDKVYYPESQDSFFFNAHPVTLEFLFISLDQSGKEKVFSCSKLSTTATPSMDSAQKMNLLMKNEWVEPTGGGEYGKVHSLFAREKKAIIDSGYVKKVYSEEEEMPDFRRQYYFLNQIIQQNKQCIDFNTGIFYIKDTTNFPLIETLTNKEGRQKVIQLLQKADFNIDSIDCPSFQYGENKTSYTIVFGMKGQTKKLYFNDQSEGTKQFLLIMPTIVHVLETGAVLLADELEAHLHPDLCRAIIELFNNPETNPKGSQLIFTTHNQDFMASSLMRPDQIYFVNKDQSTGASEVYRAADYKNVDWGNQNIQTLYKLDLLKGKPHIKELATPVDATEESA